ncbi:hypothetical protein ACJX0J_009738, partial [Zea mays]
VTYPKVPHLYRPADAFLYARIYNYIFVVLSMNKQQKSPEEHKLFLARALIPLHKPKSDYKLADTSNVFHVFRGMKTRACLIAAVNRKNETSTKNFDAFGMTLETAVIQPS